MKHKEHSVFSYQYNFLSHTVGKGRYHMYNLARSFAVCLNFNQGRLLVKVNTKASTKTVWVRETHLKLWCLCTSYGSFSHDMARLLHYTTVVHKHNYYFHHNKLIVNPFTAKMTAYPILQISKTTFLAFRFTCISKEKAMSSEQCGPWSDGAWNARRRIWSTLVAKPHALVLGSGRVEFKTFVSLFF